MHVISVSQNKILKQYDIVLFPFLIHRSITMPALRLPTVHNISSNSLSPDVVRDDVGGQGIGRHYERPGETPLRHEEESFRFQRGGSSPNRFGTRRRSRSPRRNGTIQIFVTTFLGPKTITLDVYGHDTIFSVKQMVMAKIGGRAADIALNKFYIHDGRRTLDDRSSVEACGINKGATLVFVVKKRGLALEE